MRLLSLFIFALALCACSSSSTSSPSAAPVMTGIEAGGCAVETAVASGLAGVLVAQCGAPLASATACIMASIGNANLCALPGVAATTAAQIKTAQGLFKAQAVHPRGIVGDVACPYGVELAMGIMSNAIPASCGCTTGLTGSTFYSGAVAACEAVVPL